MKVRYFCVDLTWNDIHGRWESPDAFISTHSGPVPHRNFYSKVGISVLSSQA